MLENYVNCNLFVTFCESFTLLQVRFNFLIFNRLINYVQTSSEFRKRDELMKDTKHELSATFPLLMKGTRGFDWLSAFDYFICREAHEVPLLQNIAHLSPIVKSHISSRFSLFISLKQV